ncbi:phospho-sugar mutase, partial [Streptomyces sp. tea 10]|nr:phospho-sugar mutase [Streptomyces sp. tea 10]
MSDQLLERVRQWVEHDPDPATRDELTELSNAAASGDEPALAELDSRLYGPLEFGTAGLRAAGGAGGSR